MATIQKFIPRANFALHAKQLQARIRGSSVRHASGPPPPPKPRVLEKPERFNPPSHPSRRVRQRQYPGPPLSEHERVAQKTRKYPHMMPPEGSIMHRFLTNRSIHIWITMSVLISMVVAMWYTDFVTSTPYADLLPPKSMFFAHPFTFVGRWVEVYQLHVAHTSDETAARRRQKVDDVQKRSEYRKAHGLDQAEAGILGGWTARSDAGMMGPGLREGGMPPLPSRQSEAGIGSTQEKVEGEQGFFVDFEGKKQPVRKKWFGIW